MRNCFQWAESCQVTMWVQREPLLWQHDSWSKHCLCWDLKLCKMLPS
jgi:hypothetical protein